MESMLECSSHSSSVLSCLEDRIRWWPVKHSVPSTVGMKGRWRTTPSTLGVFISSANSIALKTQRKYWSSAKTSATFCSSPTELDCVLFSRLKGFQRTNKKGVYKSVREATTAGLAQETRWLAVASGLTDKKVVSSKIHTSHLNDSNNSM